MISSMLNGQRSIADREMVERIALNLPGGDEIYELLGIDKPTDRLRGILARVRMIPDAADESVVFRELDMFLDRLSVTVHSDH